MENLISRGRIVMENLIIEPNKFYKTKSGKKAKIYEIFDNYYIGAVYFEISTLWVPLVWSKGQNIASSEGSLYDIVSEWTEPHPAESWEVDKKILVRNDEDVWFRRYFAYYHDGLIYAFDNAGTSWSEKLTSPWKFAKPAEEE